jgi:thymidylate kinase
MNLSNHRASAPSHRESSRPTTDAQRLGGVGSTLPADLSEAPGGLLGAVFAALDDASVRWCLLRGDAHDRPPDGSGGDVDLLVARADLPRAVAALKGRHLVPLAAYGRGSHRFFLGFDPDRGAFIELDIVTELAFGPHFVLHTGAEMDCLDGRGREGTAWLLRREDEFWALLLHCVLDKRTVDEQHAERLSQLAGFASLDSPLVAAWPEQTDLLAALLTAAQAGDWGMAVRQGAGLGRLLRRRERIRVARRLVGAVILRAAERPLQAWSRRGIGVALLGPDGAGKSTLARGIESSFYFPVRCVYMGLWARREAVSSKPRVVLEIAFRPLVIWRRYLESLRHRSLGRLVVFDRYVYDAMLPPTGPLVRLKRLYFWLLSRLCPAPRLVLVLDVPGRVMHLRKGEHDAAQLEADREHFRQLLGRLSNAERVDANRPADVVLADVLDRIWRRYADRSSRSVIR